MNLNDYLILGQVNSELLAVHVVAYKSLGINKQQAIACMIELSRRRLLGEEFVFESFIEDELKKLPAIPDINLSNIGSQIAAFSGLLNKK